MFVGREQEIAALRRLFERRQGSLTVVTGRRRVGKSRLLQQATTGRPTVFFQATRETATLNLAALKQVIAGVLGSDGLLVGADWSGTLHWLADAARRHPGLVVVLDEFSYLCDADPALPSLIQKLWDTSPAREAGLHLVLCGSVIAAMEALLAERNPLYGRHDAVIDVRPLPIDEAAAFFPGYTPEQMVVIHAVFGGMPYYLEACDPARPPEENVHDLLLTASGRFVDEPLHLLQAELAEPRVYASLLHAMADGCTTLNEIKQRVFGQATTSSLSVYMERLAAMRLVEARRSLDTDPRGRNTRYVVVDPLVAFWNRFVRPNLSAITLGHGADVLEHQILPGLDLYLGHAFEDICRDHVRRHGKRLFGVHAQTVGSIWSKDHDIDVVATLLDGSVVFGECKWWKKPMGEGVLDRLLETSRASGFARPDTRVHLLLCTRSGLSADLAARARAEGVAVLTPADLVSPAVAG